MRPARATGWLLACATLAGLCVTFPLVNTDIWWHLASGRWIVEHAAVPTTDPFSLSAGGVDWIDLHWLFQLAVFAVHAFTGTTGIVVGKAILCALGAVLLIKSVEENTGPEATAISTMFVLVAIFAGRWLVLARPIIVTLVLLAAYLWILERYRRRHSWKMLLALPILQLLWANAQGLHPLGPAVVSCYFAGAIIERLIHANREHMPSDAVGKLGMALLACLVVPLLNPYGWRGWSLPWKLLGRIDPEATNLFASHVSENLSPWLLARLAPEQTTPFFFFALVVLGSFLLNRTKSQLSHLFLTLVFLLLASMAVRNTLLFFWMGAPLAAINLWVYLRHRCPRLLEFSHRVCLGPIALAAMTLLILQTWHHEPDISQPAPFKTPTGATSVLTDAAANSRVFCSVRYGGHLLWKLPHLTPYIDGRLVLRTAEQFAEYLSVLDEPQRFDGLQQQHHFDFAVLPTAAPDRYLRLVEYLYHQPDWSLIYTDGTETLFAHQWDGPREPVDLSKATTVSRCVDAIYERFPHAPQVQRVALHNLASLLITVGQPKRAREVLAPLNDSTSRVLLGRCYYLDGDEYFAAAIARQVLERDSEHVDALYLLAVIAIDQGDRRAAIGHLGKILSVAPYHPEATALLDTLQNYSREPVKR